MAEQIVHDKAASVVPQLQEAMKLVRAAIWLEPGRGFVAPELDQGMISFDPVQVSVESYENAGEYVPIDFLLRKSENGSISCRKVGYVTLYTPEFLPWTTPTIYFKENIIQDVVSVHSKVAGAAKGRDVLGDQLYGSFLKDILEMHMVSGEYTAVRGSIYQGLGLLYELGILAVLDARKEAIDPNDRIPVLMLKLRDDIRGEERHYYKTKVIEVLASGIIFKEGWVPVFSTIGV